MYITDDYGDQLSKNCPFIKGTQTKISEFVEEFSISEAIILRERAFGLDPDHSAQTEPTQYSWTGAPG